MKFLYMFILISVCLFIAFVMDHLNSHPIDPDIIVAAYAGNQKVIQAESNERVLEIIAEVSVIYPDSILGDSCPTRLIVKSGNGNMHLVNPGLAIMAMISDLRSNSMGSIKYLLEKKTVMSTNVYTTYEPLLLSQ